MIRVERWGRMPYLEAWERQLALADAIARGDHADTLVSVEHPPTVTLGRHAPEADVLADAEARHQAGIAVVRSDRGGRATYHGPGQVVLYPIVAIERRGLGIKQWVVALQNALAEVVASYGLAPDCRAGSPGVWVGGAKVASIGIRVVRGVSYHGVSLNVGLDVSGFDYIVPCGAAGERITSLARACDPPPSFDDAAERLIAAVSSQIETRAPEEDCTLR
jgi:lipoyl(octanoyl) transferase